VARDVLDFFEPYESLSARHENQLTRALVVALKFSPMAHAAWLRRVDPSLALHELPAAEWRAQRRDIVPAAAEDPEGMRVISVFLSGERADLAGQVIASDRGQVLDAIALYGNELAVVIENKITCSPDDWQARRLNVGALSLNLDDAPRRIRWRDALGDFGKLVGRDLVAGAEAGVLEDFLEYTEAYLDALLPFNRLALCRGKTGARASRYPAPPASTAHISNWPTTRFSSTSGPPTHWRKPASYARSSAPAGLRQLRDDGWPVWPNFHFAHMAKGLVTTTTRRDVDAYIDLWTDEIDGARQVKRAAWDGYWTWLLDRRLAVGADRENFRRQFEDTQRQDATPRPGLRLQRSWTVKDAEDLDDDRGRLVREVRAALLAALDALGEVVSLPIV
jgi:hypothetical protein